METMTRYEREQLVIVPGILGSLPDIITTQELMIFLKKTQSSVWRLQQKYNYLFSETSPRLISKENLIKILNREALTDKEYKKQKQRKGRTREIWSQL